VAGENTGVWELFSDPGMPARQPCLRFSCSGGVRDEEGVRDMAGINVLWSCGAVELWSCGAVALYYVATTYGMYVECTE
jgi:hypothetical protein